MRFPIPSFFFLGLYRFFLFLLLSRERFFFFFFRFFSWPLSFLFFTWSLSWPKVCFLSFLLSCFLFKFPPQISCRRYISQPGNDTPFTQQIKEEQKHEPLALISIYQNSKLAMETKTWLITCRWWSDL